MVLETWNPAHMVEYSLVNTAALSFVITKTRFTMCAGTPRQVAIVKLIWNDPVWRDLPAWKNHFPISKNFCLPIDSMPTEPVWKDQFSQVSSMVVLTDRFHCMYTSISELRWHTRQNSELPSIVSWMN